MVPLRMWCSWGFFLLVGATRQKNSGCGVLKGPVFVFPLEFCTLGGVGGEGGSALGPRYAFRHWRFVRLLREIFRTAYGVFLVCDYRGCSKRALRFGQRCVVSCGIGVDLCAVVVVHGFVFFDAQSI